MSFTGQISSMPLSDVVQNLVANRKSGTLTVRTEAVEAQIVFADGAIVSYRDDRDTNFATWLVDKGVVDPSRMEDAVRRYKRAKRKTLGEILRDLKAIDIEEYHGLLRSVVEENICEILGCRDGEYAFDEGCVEPCRADQEMRSVPGGFSAPNLVMEAARRADDWEIIRRRLPGENEVWLVSGSLREHILEEEGDDEIRAMAVELLDGSRTIKEVIARLPCSRFEASECVANLIAEKKARPLDSSRVVELSAGSSDPAEAIARLKVVLEREPGNREIHEKLATLYAKANQHDQAARHHKLLAASSAAEGDLPRAREHLATAVELSPRDILSWQKLWECIVAIGDPDALREFGKEYLEHFKELGLTEIVRDHLQRLVRLFPEETAFRVELGEAHFGLGDSKAGLAVLDRLANELLRKRRLEEAERVFARILFFDKENEKARRRVEEIQSGRLERRRERRRAMLRQCLVALFIGTCVGFIVRELLVQNELLGAVRKVLSEHVIEEQRYDEAVERLEQVMRKYPYSPTAAGQGAALVESLRSKSGG